MSVVRGSLSLVCISSASLFPDSPSIDSDGLSSLSPPLSRLMESVVSVGRVWLHSVGRYQPILANALKADCLTHAVATLPWAASP